MPELHLDIAVANRFISSLSKSLQALCHGCMDFDSGIEIVGYININIDSGSKVDYVLNEKVLKSTNNSMTFVSNSFLAKKEQPKQTRDGACSPITGTAPYSTPAYHSRTWGSHLGSQHHRPSSQFAHSQVLHGAQKRQWAGDWRSSQKKHRPISTSGEALSNSQSSSQTYTDNNFKQPQLPNLGNITDNSGDSESQLIKIKKEALETDNEPSALPEADFATAQDQATEDQTSDSQTNIKIKSDPDATLSNDSEINPDDGSLEKKSTDFHGTFLEPSSGNQDIPDEESVDQSALRQITPSRVTSEASNTGADFGDEQSKASTSAVDNCETDDTTHEDEPSGSDMHLDYDQGNDDMPYPHSVHSDAGEGSSDTGQFEVIEIDDEDEDVQAMFGDPQANFRKRRKSSNVERMTTTSALNWPQRFDYNIGVDTHSTQTSAETHCCCTHCPEVLPDGFSLQRHLREAHGVIMPHVCPRCGKGYLTPSGLYYHIQASHEKKSFLCPICDAKFTRKGTIKSHLMGVHNAGQCPKCSLLVKFQDYNSHVEQCSAQEVNWPKRENSFS